MVSIVNVSVFAINPNVLLASDGAIWLTNVITFVLSYLNPDRRGPTARANGRGDPGALIFPEMKNEEHVAPRWTLKFIEYDHFATALSSTDVSANRPLTKLMMMAEEAISLVIALLATTRAVDIPRWAGGRERDAPMAEEFGRGQFRPCDRDIGSIWEQSSLGSPSMSRLAPVTLIWMKDRPGQMAPGLTSEPNCGAFMLIELRHPNGQGEASVGNGTDLISVPEAARRIGLHPDTLYRLC